MVVSQLRICRTPLQFRSGHIYIKDAQYAETNEKSYFRFFLFLVIGVQKVTKDAVKKKFFKSS